MILNKQLRLGVKMFLIAGLLSAVTLGSMIFAPVTDGDSDADLNETDGSVED